MRCLLHALVVHIVSILVDNGIHLAKQLLVPIGQRLREDLRRKHRVLFAESIEFVLAGALAGVAFAGRGHILQQGVLKFDHVFFEMVEFKADSVDQLLIKQSEQLQCCFERV